MALRATIRQGENVGRELPGARREDVDAMLLQQAEAGNTLAFERIVWRYDEIILSFLLLLTSSEQEALELCRATFVAAFKDLARRNTESFYIWLYRLAVAQWLQRRGARGDRYSARPHPSPKPGERVGHPADALSPREHLVFTMRAGQHLALRTIAQILEVPAESAAQTFCRAVGKLRSSVPQQGA